MEVAGCTDGNTLKAVCNLRSCYSAPRNCKPWRQAEGSLLTLVLHGICMLQIWLHRRRMMAWQCAAVRGALRSTCYSACSVR